MWVKNTCDSADITQLLASLKSNDSAFDEREFVFGRIKPGETREWPIKIKMPKSLPTRDDNVEVQFYRGEYLQPMDLKGEFIASTINAAKPRFSYTYWIDDVSSGNADGRLSRGESVSLYLWVKNVGEVDSEKVNIHIANESGSGILLQQGRASIDKLPVGESRLVMLKFDVSKDRPQKPPSKRIKRDRPFNPDEAVLQLTIADSAYDENIEQPIVFPVNSEPVQIHPSTLVPHSLPENVSLFTHPSKEAPLAMTTSPMNVRGTVLDNGFAIVCWQERNLQPCAFADPKLNPPIDGAQPVEVQKNNTDNSENADLPASPLNVSFNYEAPRIVFEPRKHSEKGSNATIVASITDNDALKDYEAYVWTHDGLKLKVEKLDYGLMTGKDKRIAIEMPLRPGDNTLVIVSRDRLDTETVGLFHINGEK